MTTEGPVASLVPTGKAPRASGLSRAVLVGFAVTLVLLAAAPAVLDPFTVFVLNRIVVMGLFAVAYNVVFGYAGMASLGHAALFGVGSYVVAIGQTQWAWSPIPLLLLAALLGAAVGGIMGLLAARTRGVYVLLLTLALAQAVWGLAFQQVGLTRGDNGISGIQPPFGLDRNGFYWFCLALAAVCVAALRLFVASPVGVALVGIRESESRMTALGYHVYTYRALAFSVSGLFCGVAGALQAWLSQSVNPEVVHWPVSATVMTSAVLGGASAFFGPAVGAAVLAGLEVWVSSYTARWHTVMGLIYMLTVLFLPQGVVGGVNRALQAFRRRRSPAAADPLPSGTPPQ